MKILNAALCAVACAGFATMFSGCGTLVSDPLAANVGDSNAKDQVEVRMNVQFTDIPVPEGFLLRRNLTHTFQGSSFRFGTLVYDGIWGFAPTNNWYRAEMPRSGWKLVSSRYPNDFEGEHTYSKDDETAVIHMISTDTGVRVTVKINQPAKNPQSCPAPTK